MRRSVDSGVVTFGAAVLGLLAVFWASAELRVPVLRPAAGLFLLLFAPGALVARLVGVRSDRFGTFALLAVALSFGVVTAMTLFASFVLAPLGVEAPLSFLPLAFVLSVVLAALLSLVSLNGTGMSIPRIRLAGPVPVVFLLVALPALSAAAVAGVDQFGTTAGMYVFVGAVLAVTLLTATRYVPPALYPLAVFCVSLSVFSHRNLLTDHVVGADIQASYFIANLLLDTHHWAPDLGGSMMSLSAVTAVPATVSMLTGLDVATTFKLVYVALFALVPVGLYYVNRRVFDERVALYGSLFFAFYHVSFYFTPGKQLVSELFVAAILLLVAYWGTDTTGRKVALGLLAVTLISAHYGMTYALGGSLVAAYVGLEAVDRFVGDVDHDVSPWYPAVLLGVATAFYAYSAPDLVGRLGSMPVRIGEQLLTLAVTGTVPGSGASYVQTESGLLDSLRLYLYLLMTGFVGLGVSRDVLGKLARIRRGESPEYVEYTAIAVPFFVFLGSSYFVIPNLWADRVYQMVLTVLAPYAALGYVTVFGRAGTALEWAGVARERAAGAQWSLLPVVLAALLALNSGMAFAVAGSADTSTFDGGANDLTFTTPEREAAGWLTGNVADIERYDRLRETDGETVPIYAESKSYQLFRALTLSGYTNVEHLQLKNRWRPTLNPDAIGDGYVFVRSRSVTTGESAEDLPPAQLTPEELESLTEPRDRIYSSESAQVVAANNTTGT